MGKKKKSSSGDHISVGDISHGTGIAIGRGAQATVTQGLSGEDLSELFAAIYREIERRPTDPDVDKEEITEAVAVAVAMSGSTAVGWAWRVFKLLEEMGK